MQLDHADETHGVVCRAGRSVCVAVCTQELGGEPHWCPTAASKDALHKHSHVKQVRKLLEKPWWVLFL